MNDRTDQQLLGDYANQQSEAAFAEIVRRHIDLVHSASLRMVCDAHLAEDVTQNVFVAVAQNAARLADCPVLSGWLHRTARNLAVKVVRSDVRRRAREQEAAVMNEMLAAEPGVTWEDLAPHLDAALDELNEADRDVLLLRYFERKSAREMAQTLGTSEDAAQKRVNRAVDRLREFFAKRGVTVGASALVVFLSANAVQAAPIGLSAAVVTAAVLAGTTLAATVSVPTATAIAMTTLQKALLTTTAAVLVGVGIFEADQAAQSRAEVLLLRQSQTPLLEQMAQLKAENEQLAGALAKIKEAERLSQEQLNELLSLRSRAGMSSRELAELKTTLANQPAKVPELLSQELNGFLSSLRDQGGRSFTNVAISRLRRLTAQANLNAEQQHSVHDILIANVESRTEMEVARVSGDLSLDEINRRKDKIDEDESRALAGVLTPEQLADFQKLKAEDVGTDNKNWRNGETAFMKRSMKLSDEQADRVAAALADLKPGQGGPGITYYSDARQQLDLRLRAFESILTPQQLQMYREVKLEDIEEHEKIPKIIQALKR